MTAVALDPEAAAALRAAAADTGAAMTDIASNAILAAVGDNNERRRAAAWLATTRHAKTPTQLAEAVQAHTGLTIPIAVIRLGQATGCPPDPRLGNRTKIGFSSKMTTAEIAWAGCGWWMMRPADYLAVTHSGRVALVLRTPPGTWVTDPETGRTACEAPIVLADHDAIDLKSGEIAAQTELDEAVSSVLAGEQIAIPKQQNPVRWLR